MISKIKNWGSTFGAKVKQGSNVIERNTVGVVCGSITSRGLRAIQESAERKARELDRAEEKAEKAAQVVKDLRSKMARESVTAEEFLGHTVLA